MPLGKTDIPFLEKAEQAIQAKVPQAMQAQFAVVIKAGLTIMLAPNLHAVLFKKMQAPNFDPADEAGMGAARLLGELNKQSATKLTSAIAFPAAVMFICEYLDIYNKAMERPVDPTMLAKATQIASETMLQASGVTKEQIQGYMNAKSKGAAPASGGIVNSQKQAA